MTAKRSLRIQFTSFAAQTGARGKAPSRSNMGSIGARGGYAGQVRAQQSLPRPRSLRRDRDRGDGHAEHQVREGGESPVAGLLEIHFDLAVPSSAERCALAVCCVDRSSSYIARTDTPRVCATSTARSC